MNKKVILYLGGILLLIIIVVGLIIFLNSRSKSPTPDIKVQVPQNTDQTNNPPDTTTPVTPPAVSRIQKLSDEPVVSAALGLTNEAVWYFTSDGSLFKVRLSDGLKQEFLLNDKAPTTDAIWPTSGDDFILQSGTGLGKTFRYFNATDKKFTSYPSNFKGVDFTSDARSILYNWVKDAQSTLSSGDLKNTQFQNIIDLPEAGLTIKAGPNLTRVLAYNKENPTNGKLYLVLIDDKRVVTLNTVGDNSAIWSPNGQHFLYRRDPDGTKTNTNLWLGDSKMPVDTDLGIVGSVSKATFDSTGANLYIALTDNLGSDTIWKINTSTLAKTQVLRPASTDTPSAINVSNLLIASDNSAVFFKNSDGYLYGYKIGQ